MAPVADNMIGSLYLRPRAEQFVLSERRVAPNGRDQAPQWQGNDWQRRELLSLKETATAEITVSERQTSGPSRMQVVMQDPSITGFCSSAGQSFLRVANRGICQLLGVLCTFALAYVCLWKCLFFLSISLSSCCLARLAISKL